MPPKEVEARVVHVSRLALSHAEAIPKVIYHTTPPPPGFCPVVPAWQYFYQRTEQTVTEGKKLFEPAIIGALSRNECALEEN